MDNPRNCKSKRSHIPSRLQLQQACRRQKIAQQGRKQRARAKLRQSLLERANSFSESSECVEGKGNADFSSRRNGEEEKKTDMLLEAQPLLGGKSNNSSDGNTLSIQHAKSPSSSFSAQSQTKSSSPSPDLGSGGGGGVGFRSLPQTAYQLFVADLKKKTGRHRGAHLRNLHKWRLLPENEKDVYACRAAEAAEGKFRCEDSNDNNNNNLDQNQNERITNCLLDSSTTAAAVLDSGASSVPFQQQQQQRQISPAAVAATAANEHEIAKVLADLTDKKSGASLRPVQPRPPPIQRHVFTKDRKKKGFNASESSEAKAAVPAVAQAQSSSTSSKSSMNTKTKCNKREKYSSRRVRQRINPSDGSVAPVTQPRRTVFGLFKRPAGRSRKGMQWDEVKGVWLPEEANNNVIIKSVGRRKQKVVKRKFESIQGNSFRVKSDPVVKVSAPADRATKRSRPSVDDDTSTLLDLAKKKLDLAKKKQPPPAMQNSASHTFNNGGQVLEAAAPNDQNNSKTKKTTQQQVQQPTTTVVGAVETNDADERSQNSWVPNWSLLSLPSKDSGSTINPHQPVESSRAKYSYSRVRERTSAGGTVVKPVKPPVKRRNGLYRRPVGRTRKGMFWDEVKGVWVATAVAGGKIKAKAKTRMIIGGSSTKRARRMSRLSGVEPTLTEGDTSLSNKAFDEEKEDSVITEKNDENDSCSRKESKPTLVKLLCDGNQRDKMEKCAKSKETRARREDRKLERTSCSGQQNPQDLAVRKSQQGNPLALVNVKKLPLFQRQLKEKGCAGSGRNQFFAVRRGNFGVERALFFDWDHCAPIVTPTSLSAGAPQVIEYRVFPTVGEALGYLNVDIGTDSGMVRRRLSEPQQLPPPNKMRDVQVVTTVNQRFDHPRPQAPLNMRDILIATKDSFESPRLSKITNNDIDSPKQQPLEESGDMPTQTEIGQMTNVPANAQLHRRAQKPEDKSNRERKQRRPSSTEEEIQPFKKKQKQNTRDGRISKDKENVKAIFWKTNPTKMAIL